MKATIFSHYEVPDGTEIEIRRLMFLLKMA